MLGWFADPFLSFGGGAAGGALAVSAAGREGEDRGVQPGDGRVSAGRAPVAVGAAGVCGDSGAGEGQHGGEGDLARGQAGGGGGAGGALTKGAAVMDKIFKKKTKTV